MRSLCMKKYVLNQTFSLVLYSTKIHFCTTINRTSSEFQLMHAYDQQSWLIFHCLGLFFFFFDRLKSIVSKSSDGDFWVRLTIVSVTCWSSSISKKVVIFTKPKKNQKTAMKKTNITDEEIWMKIILYASKSTADSIQ